MLTLTNFGEYSRASALTLKATERAVKALVFFYSYFRHCLPSLAGTLFFRNVTIIQNAEQNVNKLFCHNIHYFALNVDFLNNCLSVKVGFYLLVALCG